MQMILRRQAAIIRRTGANVRGSETTQARRETRKMQTRNLQALWKPKKERMPAEQWKRMARKNAFRNWSETEAAQKEKKYPSDGDSRR